MSGVGDVWVYLSQSPLLWLTVTVWAYLGGYAIYAKAGLHPALNPVLIAVAVIAGLLVVTDTGYQTYFDGAQFVHFLLGPATVALAVPLFENAKEVRKTALPILCALVAGAATAVASAVAVVTLLGGSDGAIASIAPKSVTTPIAMGISERIGGLPSLTAVLVIFTGIFGAIAVTPLFNLLRVTDWRARGFATGLAAHGIGTARAFQVNPVAGAFAGLAMGLNGLATAILAPLLFLLLG